MTKFKVGNEPWNKGLRGIHLSKKTEFKKGISPWNKGKRGYTTCKKSKGFIDSFGYFVFFKKGVEVKEHRLIWENHNGKIPKGYIIHHKNENRLDNDISNLELVTRAEHSRIHKFAEKMRGSK
jgi:hypothetical protein